jgi:hypothetical protein
MASGICNRGNGADISFSRPQSGNGFRCEEYSFWVAIVAVFSEPYVPKNTSAFRSVFPARAAKFRNWAQVAAIAVLTPYPRQAVFYSTERGKKA